MDTRGTLVQGDIWLEEWVVWSKLSEIIEAGLKESGMNIVKKTYHQFMPQGETCVWILAESHLAIHTYPEEKFFAIDVFTCGKEGNAKKAVNYIEQRLLISDKHITTSIRGVKRN